MIPLYKILTPLIKWWPPPPILSIKYYPPPNLLLTCTISIKSLSCFYCHICCCCCCFYWCCCCCCCCLQLSKKGNYPVTVKDKIKKRNFGSRCKPFIFWWRVVNGLIKTSSSGLERDDKYIIKSIHATDHGGYLGVSK